MCLSVRRIPCFWPKQSSRFQGAYVLNILTCNSIIFGFTDRIFVSQAMVIVWNYKEGTIKGSYETHKVGIVDLCFTCNSNFLVSLGGRDDGNVIIWDVQKNSPICGIFSSINICIDLHEEFQLMCVWLEKRRMFLHFFANECGKFNCINIHQMLRNDLPQDRSPATIRAVTHIMLRGRIFTASVSLPRATGHWRSGESRRKSVGCTVSTWKWASWSASSTASPWTRGTRSSIAALLPVISLKQGHIETVEKLVFVFFTN